ncbi:MAG: EF-Tu/IF-2/RF-3 family GTPase [Candidatus Micrarchaeaceae archaeon]|jgi:selenocysteine-specific translation elongation factor
MTNTIIAIPFDEELAEFIGKKGSENSITFYNRKADGNTIVAVMPSSLEDKFYALPQCMLVADRIIVSTKSIDKALGEVLVACSVLGKSVVFTKDNDISNLLSAIKLENYSFCDTDRLLDAITEGKAPGTTEQKRIDLDKAFNVKGIGTVVLGVVTKGVVKVHDNLYHNSGKTVGVRSLQSQDEDIKEAGPGTRVGIALKGIEDSEMKKGDILSSAQTKTGRQLELDVNNSAFAKEVIEPGKNYSIATGFSYSSAVVEDVKGTKVKLKLEKAICAEPNDKFMLVRAIAPRIFASGRIENIL